MMLIKKVYKTDFLFILNYVYKIYIFQQKKNVYFIFCVETNKIGKY